jgi:hypothetical protein
LAGTCGRWRRIALDTPRLWSDITLEMGSNMDLLQDYWRRTKERVKNAPLTIRISDICLAGPGSLSTIHFGSSLNIEFLRLHFEHWVNLSMLPEMLGGSSIEVTDMVISVGRHHLYPRGIPFHSIGVPEDEADCGRLLEQIKCRRRLTIDLQTQLNFAVFEGNSLLHLELMCVKFDLIDLFHVFPCIKKLALYRCSFELPSTMTQVTQLLSLTIGYYKLDEWFSSVHFSNLTKLTIRSSTCKGLGAFLSSHQTVTTLDVEVCGASMGELEEILAVAPQVETLEFHVDEDFHFRRPAWADAVVSKGAFPLLKSLTIVDRDGYLPGSFFEWMVKARCLPASHAQCTARSSATLVNEFFMVGAPGSVNSWCMTPLYLQATKEAVKYLTEDGDELVITQLEWTSLGPEVC